MPADPKAELLRQIRTIRARLDPNVLAKAERAAQATQPGGQGPGADPGADPGVEPYDKEAARNAVMLFLQSRHDGGRFATQVMEKLKQPEAAAKAYGRGAGMGPGKR
ncbi:MAG: hypothetical protein RLY86_3387 [Pseudomonadota bacterium]|jgi:hypothetical protein